MGEPASEANLSGQMGGWVGGWAVDILSLSLLVIQMKMPSR